ncbi:hypothetical protein [Paracoccus sp. S1E-3]|nr:hypothetical protein [Paracoccus sp. S1E-3]
MRFDREFLDSLTASRGQQFDLLMVERLAARYGTSEGVSDGDQLE